jgi:hypothetical protein
MQMKKRLFQLNYLEYHDPANWEGVKAMRRTIREAIEAVIKFKTLSVKCIPDPAENDGWYQVEITITFYAADVEAAIKIVEDNNLYDESSGVYSGFEKVKGKWVRAFTEEGKDEPEPVKPPDVGECSMEEFERGIK